MKRSFDSFARDNPDFRRFVYRVGDLVLRSDGEKCTVRSADDRLVTLSDGSRLKQELTTAAIVERMRSRHVVPEFDRVAYDVVTKKHSASTSLALLASLNNFERSRAPSR